MKRVTINAYQVGLVFKREVYQRMLTEGKYWLGYGEKISYHDKFQPFDPAQELNVYLQDAALAEALQVIEVKDNEIVLQYENGLLKKVLTPGRYAYWKSLIDYKFIPADISKIEITEQLDRATLQSKYVMPYVWSYAVESYEQALLLVDGKYIQTLSGGSYFWWKNNISVQLRKADTRQLQLEINGQEILTKDKAGLRINAWVQYKVTDIVKALLENKDYERQLHITVQLALREHIAAFTFDELLERKDTISVTLDVAALGVEVSGLGIRDIILPGDMKDIMNQVLVAEKKAQANIIMRREETASTRSLLNTAKLMEDNPMLFKLKEMEYVEKIAEKINSISVSGNGVLIDQLRQIFVTQK